MRLLPLPEFVETRLLERPLRLGRHGEGRQRRREEGHGEGLVARGASGLRPRLGGRRR